MKVDLPAEKGPRKVTKGFFCTMVSLNQLGLKRSYSKRCSSIWMFSR